MAAAQSGVIAVRTALAEGLTRAEIRWKLTSGRWQRPMPGALVTHSGPLTHRQRLWCAIESVGPPAFLAGASAAALDGLNGFPTDQVFLVVPASRQPSTRAGVTIHRSVFLGDADVHPSRQPPRTRLERSVLDMASWARSDDDARAAIAAAVQQRLTTAELLRAAFGRTGSRARSSLIAQTLDDVAGGAQSVAELAYRRLERRYNLPTGRFQAPVELNGRRRYLDVWYEPWRVWVEIDGSHHREARQWRDDLDRQNAGVLDGRLILRFPTLLLRDAPEKVAAQVAEALRSRGWSGPDRRRSK
jgi:very-short-patch-repair endonuclease